MRLSLALAAALLCAPAAIAQTPPAATPCSLQGRCQQRRSTPAQARPDPVVAKVNGRELHLSDVSEAAQNPAGRGSLDAAASAVSDAA